MNDQNEWEKQFDAEIKMARSAREKGNDGMARVCARRAAGIVVGAYLNSEGFALPGPSAVERLKYLASLPTCTQEMQLIINHMLIKVTPEYKLPIEADLIADAQRLRQLLLKD